jgi:hypothetical protein
MQITQASQFTTFNMADVGDKVNGEGSEKGNGDSNDKK